MKIFQWIYIPHLKCIDIIRWYNYKQEEGTHKIWYNLI